MEHIKFNKILRNIKILILRNLRLDKLNGFSLVEVLVSLAIISSSILIILTSVAQATHRATLNKLHIEMVNSASAILSKTQDVLYQKYKESNWGSLLNGYIQLKVVNGQLKIAPANIACIPNENPLNQQCPSVSIINEHLNYFAYIIKAQPTSLSNVYKLTITIACKEHTKCNAAKITPVKNELYVVKY